MQFQGFKPEAMPKIANSLGYQGDMQGFQQYLDQNEDKKQIMDQYMKKAEEMARGGSVRKKYNEGGLTNSGLDAINAGVAYENELSNNLAASTGMTGITQDPSMSSSNGQNLADLIGNMGPDAYPEGTAIYQASAPMMATADPRALPQQTIPQANIDSGANLQQAMVQQATSPGLPVGSAVVPVGTQLTAGQLVSPQSGQVQGQVAVPTAMAGVSQATSQAQTPAAQVQATQVAGQVQGATAQQGQVSAPAQVNAAQMSPQQLAQLNLQAAQGQAATVQGAPTRQLETGELISGSAVDQQKVEDVFGDQKLEAATVQGEMADLMQQFQGGQTPAWAAGAMRNANAALAARGLGASSMAGMAVVQAAMEAALPIAQMDASNKQQVALESARQRANFLNMEFTQEFQTKVQNAAKISEIANMNFTADQQVALENAKMAQTMNLANLSNRQAKVMADAASMANMDMANLNNRQQAAVQNAQSFLQMDMANLSNRQQTELFNSQQQAQALFTDQAAENAAKQFNATSQNQVDQFFASLAANTSQFNASQSNAQAQFNAGQQNVVERFNAEMNNQREQFNAQNRLVIDQNNAQWRREIATADTAAVNRANEINAGALLGVSQTAYNNLWQNYSDNMEWAWTSAENERSRVSRLAEIKLQADAQFNAQKYKSDAEASSGFGQLIGTLFTSDLSKTLAGSILGKIF